MKPSSLASQIAAVKQAASGGHMTPSHKALHVQQLRDAIDTLEWLQRNREAIRAAMAGRGKGRTL